MTTNIEYLLENGPSPSEQLPNHPHRTDRDRGMTKFAVSSSRSTKMGGPVTAVYYVHGEHEKAEILRAFLRANPRIVETKRRRDFHMLLDNNWLDAARAVTPEFFDVEAPEGGDIPSERECPICGETFEGELPRHLHRECSESSVP